MPQMTLKYDDKTDALFDELKTFFGVKTKAAVVKRSLAIARAAVKHADTDKTVRFERPDNPKIGETFILNA